MPDICDMAQQAESLELQAALSRTGLPFGPGPEMIDGVACCRDCGLPIHPERLAALPGCSRCVQCQLEAEE